MPFFARSGGAWRTITAPQVRTGGAWTPPIALWAYSGGAWRLFWEPGAVQGGNKASTQNGGLAPSVMFNQNGSVSWQATGSGGAWYSPLATNIGRGYYIQFTQTGSGGIYAGSTLNAWHRLDSSPNVGHADNTGGSSTFTYEISRTSGGTVLVSGTITITGDGT